MPKDVLLVFPRVPSYLGSTGLGLTLLNVSRTPGFSFLIYSPQSSLTGVDIDDKPTFKLGSRELC